MTIKYAVVTGLIIALSSCSGSTSELLAAKKEQKQNDSQTAGGPVDAKDIVGQLQDHQIASLNGRKITGQLSGSLVDWRALPDDMIYGSSIRSIDGRKITGRIDAGLVNWDRKKTYTIKVSADSVQGQLSVDQLPSSIPFSTMTFAQEDRIPAENLPELGADKLPAIPPSKIEGVLAAAQLPPLEQLTGTLTAEQLPELAAMKGSLPADRLTGTISQEALSRVPAASVTFHSEGGKTKSSGKGPLSNSFADDKVNGNYYWYRVGKMVTMQFALTREGGGDTTPVKIELPVGDVPLPTEAMFSDCRKLSSTYFIDYAFGSATIWPNDSLQARAQPLVLTSLGSANCPDPRDPPGRYGFQFYAPEFPSGSRVSGVITYISDPKAEDDVAARLKARVADHD